MTFRHLKIFVSLYENNFNTTKTAASMHMTQPAVSLAVKELEQYYGVALFDRIGNRLKITPAGLRFYEYSSHIIALFDEMDNSMKNWDLAGTIRVGSSITIGSQFLPAYVNSFQSRYPGTRVKAQIAPSKQLEQMILNNELDFALIEGSSHNPSFICEEYMEDHLTVICPANGQFQPGQEISIHEFCQQNFLLREHGSGTRETFENTIAAAGFSIEPIWEAVSTTALVNAVISGIGISILPHRMIADAIQQGQVIAVTVKGLEFKRKFNIIYHQKKFLTAAARSFIELCRSQKA
ncbi:MAG: LysR family transcriptional regulator [Lachnospiraceae bacterium]|nr:LysR family transcriptional regulator [Lachnospiraceae bacterium]